MHSQIPDNTALRRLLIEKLAGNTLNAERVEIKKPSAVLCLIGNNEGLGPHFILTKRSHKVPQPGDLSFPGGGPNPLRDKIFAKFVSLPQMPLARWPHRKEMVQKTPSRFITLKNHLATSLRESYEEIRLPPFNVDFLGTLPPQNLIMFKRTIFPMVGWLKRPTRFKINQEVSAIMTIPLKDLLNPEKYANYRLNYASSVTANLNHNQKEFPCFVFQQGDKREVLWGVTFRIVMTLLHQVFDFELPKLEGRPVINGRIGESYYRNNSKKPV